MKKRKTRFAALMALFPLFLAFWDTPAALAAYYEITSSDSRILDEACVPQ